MSGESYDSGVRWPLSQTSRKYIFCVEVRCMFVPFKKNSNSRKYLFDPPPASDDYNVLPEAERPGGFAWGQTEDQMPHSSENDTNNEDDNTPPPDAN